MSGTVTDQELDLWRRVGEYLVVEHWIAPRRALRRLIGEIDTILRDHAPREVAMEESRSCRACRTVIVRQPSGPEERCHRCGGEIAVFQRVIQLAPEGLPPLNIPPRQWKRSRSRS